MADLIVEVEGLDVILGDRTVLADVNATVETGSFVAVLGPNGCGKTTFLRALFGAVRPARGCIRVEGRSIESCSRRELGRTFAVLRQEPALAFDFLVEELVLMGRSPHKSMLEPDRPEDHACVARAMGLADVAHLAGRAFSSLSGGEKQRVLLARAIAQEPRVLLLDEPTNHLDIRHQLEILAAVRSLGITVIAALHDLNLALAYASRAVLLVEGRVVTAGPTAEVLTEPRVRDAFGVGVSRFSDAHGTTLGFYVPSA